MEADEAADRIREATEGERGGQREAGQFRTRTAMVVAFRAMLLAIASLGKENSSKEMINSNIRASDTWAFFQAKNIRQTDYQLASDHLETVLATGGTSLGPEVRQSIQDKINLYMATSARYESEPDPQHPEDFMTGQGKKELTLQARYWEARRDRAQKQIPNLDYSAALFQIAIVLSSVAIIATSRHVIILSLVVGAVAALLMLNGFFLFYQLPLE